jgi:hypothetical protein
MTAFRNQHKNTTLRDLQYKIRWMGYDVMWELITDLKGTANEMLKDYHAKHGHTYIGG